MTTDTSNVYDNKYYSTYVKDYSDSEFWSQRFLRIAKEIIDAYHPKTFLDVGCAFGYLVAAMRDLGVEAYGVDISPYAISKVREDIKPYCRACNVADGLPENFPKKFDCISTIEVIEHLYEKDAQNFIHNICERSDRVIFSSSPDDFAEPTHVNVHEIEYWAERFAREGLYREMNAGIFGISNYTTVFQRMDLSISKVAEHYEKQLRMLRYNNARSMSVYYDLGDGFNETNKIKKDVECDDSGNFKVEFVLPDAEISNLRFDPVEGQFVKIAIHDIKIDDQNCDYLCGNKKLCFNGKWLSVYSTDPNFVVESFPKNPKKVEIKGCVCNLTEKDIEDFYTNKLANYHKTNKELRRDLNDYKEELAKVNNGSYEIDNNDDDDEYKNMGPMRALLKRMVAFILRVLGYPMRVCYRVLKKIYHKYPILQRLRRFLIRVKHNGFAPISMSVSWRYRYHKYFPRRSINAKFFAPMKILDKQYEHQPSNVKISIVVPLFNTEKQWLIEMIDSMLNQTYQNWELILADASTKSEPAEIVAKYTAVDKRIVYKKLESNDGIAENTNRAIEFSTGEYIALCDHDDILHPCALWYVAEKIEKEGADFIYTDECTFEGPIYNIIRIHFKPDFAPDHLLSTNYICHFTVFSRELMEKAGGGERTKYNGSQDYDIILRLTEKAKKVSHVAHSLYYWRATPNSTALDISAKTYCITAGERALQDHFDRVGIDAKVSSLKNKPGFYKTDYKIEGSPLISILIPNKDHIHDLEKCINSIYEKSTYKNFEIIIIENASTKNETYIGYQHLLLKHPDNLQIVTWQSKHGFNYSALNNYGVQFANGKYLLFLNNDTEVISPNWIEEMLMYVQQKRIGCAGAMLYYPDDTVQHAGVGLALGGVAGHLHRLAPRGSDGYFGRMDYVTDVFGVTGACLMMRKDVFIQVHGFNEKFAVAFNDVDLCMRVWKAGYQNIFTPYAELYHYESKSRGSDTSPAKARRFASEVRNFETMWKDELEAGDPFLNQNFNRFGSGFDLDIKPFE